MFGLMLRSTHNKEVMALRADVERERDACAIANSRVTETVYVRMKRGKRGYWRADIRLIGEGNRPFLLTNIGLEFEEAAALRKHLSKALRISNVYVEE